MSLALSLLAFHIQAIAVTVMNQEKRHALWLNSVHLSYFVLQKIYWFRVISSPHLFECLTWTSTLIWLISCWWLINGVWTRMSWLLTLQTENPSVIYFEGKDYTFEGFSMFCHHPLEHVSLNCFPFPSTLFFLYNPVWPSPIPTLPSKLLIHIHLHIPFLNPPAHTLPPSSYLLKYGK